MLWQRIPHTRYDGSEEGGREGLLEEMDLCLPPCARYRRLISQAAK